MLTLCIFFQAVAMYNSTYVPFEDPQSVTNARITITLRSSDTAPHIAQSYYEATLKEGSNASIIGSEVDTVVPNININVTGTNLVCGGVLLIVFTT